MPTSLERLVEHPARRAHERPPLDVLAVAGLLADHHHLGALAALAEHGLRAVAPQVAGAAPGCGGAQLLQRPASGAAPPSVVWPGSATPGFYPGWPVASARGS